MATQDETDMGIPLPEGASDMIETDYTIGQDNIETQIGPFGRRIVISWNCSTEAARVSSMKQVKRGVGPKTSPSPIATSTRRDSSTTSWVSSSPSAKA